MGRTRKKFQVSVSGQIALVASRPIRPLWQCVCLNAKLGEKRVAMEREMMSDKPSALARSLVFMFDFSTRSIALHSLTKEIVIWLQPRFYIKKMLLN